MFDWMPNWLRFIYFILFIIATYHIAIHGFNFEGTYVEDEKEGEQNEKR
jgi:hypothetical protein